MKSFRGGMHVRDEKARTSGKAIEKSKEPAVVIVPMLQHIGTPSEPLVKEGDTVKAGQKIGDSKSFISAPVHAPVSGKVTAVGPRPHPLGSKVVSIVIENNGDTSFVPAIEPVPDPLALSPERIREAVREGGIVGMGGAAFPTYVKLTPIKDRKIDSYLLNGAECEPYLTADERLMIESAGRVIAGMKIMMRALGVTDGYVGIEDNKPEALRAMESATAPAGIRVVKLRTKYPQGAEKQLIKAVLGRTVPAGELPSAVGAVVNNVATAAAVAELFATGMPLIKRIVTVTGGAVREPKNLEVKIGTTFADVLSQCGGLVENTAKLIMGGPMMGIAQYTDEIPVIKGCSGILALTKEEIDEYPPGPCIRCGKCIAKCPMGTSPALLGVLAENKKWDSPELKDALDCIECGICAFVCPSKRHLIQYIKEAKARLQEKK
jgi:electron transport complex protein RnfC